MFDDDQNGAWSVLAGGALDPGEQEVLVERLQLAAESLRSEFVDLSRSDARRLILASAQAVLADASVAQFVPTFAVRRARRLLLARQAHSRAELAGALAGVLSSPETVSIDLSDNATQPAVETEPVIAATLPAQVADSCGAAAVSLGGARPEVLRRPDEFYGREAKRLLERARRLRAATLSAISDGAGERDVAATRSA